MLQRMGDIPERDLFNTFNCGVGMVVIASAASADKALSALREGGCDAYPIGEIVPGEDRVVLC